MVFKEFSISNFIQIWDFPDRPLGIEKSSPLSGLIKSDSTSNKVQMKNLYWNTITNIMGYFGLCFSLYFPPGITLALTFQKFLFIYGIYTQIDPFESLPFFTCLCFLSWKALDFPYTLSRNLQTFRVCIQATTNLNLKTVFLKIVNFE